MTFNIFGDATKEDIRVGYISTERGYISDVTICAANSYAQANPGTTFIFQTRKETKYLNINEVNKLTPNDLDSDIDTCPGVELDAECGRPKVIFKGGGGVGAKANPIVGTDGSILGVDLVHGGFGYQYPPQVEVRDPCGIGAGPVTEAFLGQIIDTVQTYEDEEDFEQYEVCDDERGGFGKQVNAEGKVIGEWDPQMYTDNHKNPFDKEVSDYQKQLKEFKNPWWNSRQEPPSKITSPGKSTKTKYDVKDIRWGEFMNEYAISPVPHSNVKGSDFAGKTYSLEWDLEVPYDGEYTFRGAADNEGKLYIDNKQVSIYHHNYKGPAIKAKKKLTEGSHNIRLDLFNTPEMMKVAEQNFTLSGGAVLELEEWEDGDWQDLVCYVDEGRFTNIVGGRCKFVVDASGEFPAGAQKDIEVRITSASEFINQIEIVDLFVVSGPEVDTVGNKIQLNKKFKQTIEVGKTYDVIVKTLVGDSPGAKLRTRSLPAKSLPIPTSTGSNYSKKNIFNTVESIDKANRPLWRTNVYARGGFLNDNGVCPFDTTVQLEDNPYAGDHTIVWNSVEFPVDGQYLIEIAVDDNVDLKIGDQLSIRKEGFTDQLPNGWPDNSDGKNKSTGVYKQSHYIKKGMYPVTAILHQIRGGKFGFSGIKGINPMALAINIATAYTEKEVQAQKSFNQNPMGVSLTIEAPLPAIPQQPLPQQEGRCPPNPIWSTRFPNGDQKWHPVKFKGWSKYLNKYAMSPIPPLSTPNSDGGGGIQYRNKWTMNAPYGGFYKLKGEVDDIAKIYIDGEVKLDLSSKVGKTKGENLFKLSEGNHQIEVEVENLRFEKFKLIDQQVFNTADWIVADAVTDGVTNVSGPKNVDVTFKVASNAANANRITMDGVFEFSKVRKGAQINETVTKNLETGKVYTLNLTGRKLKTTGEQVLGMEDATDDDYNDILCSSSVGKFYDIDGTTCKFVIPPTVTSTVTSIVKKGLMRSGSTKAGVTYEGPDLASYRSGPLGPELTPAWKDDADYRANNMDKTWVMKWKDVNFPSKAEYTIRALADDILKVRIGGVEVAEARVFQGVRTFNVQLDAGKKDIELELYNIPGNPTNTFRTNPTVAAVKISARVSVGTGITKPWTVNPIGISAHIVPPPCPKKVEGKGVVTDVKVIAPGNGFNPPEGPGYPALLKLKSVDIIDPGINNSGGAPDGDDEVVIEPANGAKLRICGMDSFGRINKICIDDAGSGWTEYPSIRVISPTGINATLIPQFEIIRDPLGVPADQLVQVTDLVGVKQTGYYDGRPYYGAVFYEEGIKYAGYYKTIGEPIQIYDTLQESIDAEVTTLPSAIQRQGTDISSNDPRLNIPGTPQNLTDN